MTDLNTLALSLIEAGENLNEARKEFDRARHPHENEAFDHWQTTHDKFKELANPEAVIQLARGYISARDEALEEAIKAIKVKFPPSVASGDVDGVDFDGQMYPSSEILATIQALKSPPQQKDQ
jgi:hypothetical protein